uniref:SAM domain-containing protein n=1 Tax=Romanomermis culicivorax TaxID=13658 RepID=A0A915JG26_ROMCU
MWDENDVADWYKSWINKADYQMTSLSSLLCSRLRDNGINGYRLRLITDNDLRHMGVGNAMFRNRFLDEIRHLWTDGDINGNGDDTRTLFDSTLRYDGDSSRTYELNATLLTGYYIREGISLETHKWKPFLDVDDVDEYENGTGLFQKVTLRLHNDPSDKIET